MSCVSRVALKQNNRYLLLQRQCANRKHFRWHLPEVPLKDSKPETVVGQLSTITGCPNTTFNVVSTIGCDNCIIFVVEHIGDQVDFTFCNNCCHGWFSIKEMYDLNKSLSDNLQESLSKLWFGSRHDLS